MAAPALSGLIERLREGEVIVPGSGVQVVDYGRGLAVPAPDGASMDPHGDLADVVGQPVARRAAEISAAGSHHMLLLGPPGTGKPMREIKHSTPTSGIPVFVSKSAGGN